MRQTAWVRAGFGLYALALLDEAGEVAERGLLLYRAVLSQIDIGLHTGQLSLGDALKLLADRFPLQPREALAAIRGVLVDPGAATGAIVTRRELLRLRDDRRRALGAAFSHQGITPSSWQYGGLPVSLVRWGMGVERMKPKPVEESRSGSKSVVPSTVKGLSAVSLLNDFASEMVYPLLPAFVTRTLGGGALALGALDGAADFTASLLRALSGRWADRPGWQRPLILAGYGSPRWRVR